MNNSSLTKQRGTINEKKITRKLKEPYFMSIKKLKRLLDKLELNKSVKKGDEAELNYYVKRQGLEKR